MCIGDTSKWVVIEEEEEEVGSPEFASPSGVADEDGLLLLLLSFSVSISFMTCTTGES